MGRDYNGTKARGNWGETDSKLRDWDGGGKGEGNSSETNSKEREFGEGMRGRG